MPTKQTSNEPFHGNSPDSRAFALEEYKTLRGEILQNTQDNIKILQFGLTLAASLLSFAYLDAVQASGFRWLYLFTNSILLAPLVMLHAQRIRASWKLSYYIQKRLEPILGMQWETFSMWSRLGGSKPEKRLTIHFIYAMTLPLMFIQGISPIFSAFDLFSMSNYSLSSVTTYEIFTWAALTFITLMLLIIEARMTREANRPKSLVKEWDQQLDEIEKSLASVTPKASPV
jgi:hypothetical protein